MFGPFRITSPLSGGLLWKIPWRLSKFQKRRHRERLRAVDSVVATLDAALSKQGQVLPALEQWKAEMPTEAEMLPKDKYTLFDRKAKRYRKGIHSTSLSGESRWSVRGLLANDLLLYRAAQVDQGFSESQSSWFLSGAHSNDADGRMAGISKGFIPTVDLDSRPCTTFATWLICRPRMLSRMEDAELDWIWSNCTYNRACTNIVCHGMNKEKALELIGSIFCPRVS